MEAFKRIIFAAFAVFAIFFGAGNLVLPINVGIASQGNLFWSIAGLTLSGIILPYIALIVPMLGQRMDTLLSALDKASASFMLFMLIAFIGPLGAIPRCITVAFAGFREVLSLLGANIGLWLFGLIFLLLCLILVRSSDGIVHVIGKYLAPLLALGLFIMFALAWYHPSVIQVNQEGALHGFDVGIWKGYNTMDMLAGVVFCPMVARYTSEKVEGEKQKLYLGITSSTLGMLLLAVVYASLVYTGAKFSKELAQFSEDQLFTESSRLVLGHKAAILSAITVFLACLTSVVALMELSITWIAQTSFMRISNASASLVVIILSYLMTLLGFDTLALFLSKVMSVIYPALIGLSVGVCIDKIFDTRSSRWCFWGASVVSLVYHSHQLLQNILS